MRGREWTLSGPGKFARAIAADLDEGRSVTLVLPDSGIPNGLRSAVRDVLPDLSVNFLQVESATNPRQRVVDALCEVLGLSRSPGGRLEVDDFSGHPELDRRLIWADCRSASSAQTRAWGTFLKHYAAAAAAVPVYRRTVFSTVCSGKQAAAMPDSDRLASKRWWWGAMGPLDTAVFVSDLLDGERVLPGFAEVVTEVAGFDLSVASMLVESWDGDPGHLQPLLLEHHRDPFDGMPVAGAEPSPGSRPSPELLSLWSRGLVNAWGEHDPHFHPCHICASKPGDLRHLVWRGQIKSLMPRIEIERQWLAEWVYERRDRLPPRWAGEDIMGLEVGQLATLFNEVPELVRRDRQMTDRAHWLRRARNQIAHLEILDRRELERAEQVFSGDRINNA